MLDLHDLSMPRLFHRTRGMETRSNRNECCRRGARVFFWVVLVALLVPLASAKSAERGSRVRGTVGDRDWRFPTYSGLRVLLHPTGRESVTDDGFFAFDGVPDGDYELRVAPPCVPLGCWSDKQVSVRGETVVVQVGLRHQGPALEGSLISGVVLVNDSGYPGLTVLLYPTGRLSETDASGGFFFDDVPDGDYELWVYPPCTASGCWSEAPVVVRGEDLTIELRASSQHMCGATAGLRPDEGAEGDYIEFFGKCQTAHSGRPVYVLFDRVLIERTRGETDGSYHHTFRVPWGAATGEHEIVHNPGVIVFGVFIVTGQSTACAGDCNGNGAVSIDELIRGVVAALPQPRDFCANWSETRSCDACAITFDSDHDGEVSIADLVAAVLNALNGCAVPATGPTL